MFQKALRDWVTHGNTTKDSGHGDGMHWLPHVERVGVLGSMLKRANHFAITVSDVGRSLEFYHKVLGLQQIRRPNFDRHGAWLTAGNLELHLILGPPTVPETDSLIVGHLSFESDDIMECRRLLKEGNVDFTQNVSVPNRDQSTIVTQFFLRDPDGYYIEICNCDILTKFCLSRDHHEGITYSEHSVAVSLAECLQLLQKAAWAKDARKQRLHEKPQDLILPGPMQAAEADPQILANLLKRAKVWGDIMQGESEEAIATALKEGGNSAPLATRIIRAKKDGVNHLKPPAVYKDGELLYQPEEILFSASKAVQEASGFDKKFVEDPHARYRVLFEVIDTEGAGEITEGELRQLLSNLYGGASEEERDEMLAELAREQSGNIGWEAFVGLCEKTQQLKSAETWGLLFDLCDDDGNGMLQAPELCHKLADLGMQMCDAEMEEIFIDADHDGDGVLSRQEFAAFMTDLPVDAAPASPIRRSASPVRSTSPVRSAPPPSIPPSLKNVAT